MYKDLCVKVEEDKEMELGLECRPATRIFSKHNMVSRAQVRATGGSPAIPAKSEFPSPV
jgi:hypothetical protein